MAYNFSKENQKILLTLDKNARGDKVVVTEISSKDSNELLAIDIRNYYINSAGEAAPTQKGIRIPADMLSQVVKAIETCLSTENM